MAKSKRRRKAIADAREGRQSHVYWIRIGEEHGPGCNAVKTAGDPAYHRRWVKAYDRILRELGAKP